MQELLLVNVLFKVILIGCHLWNVTIYGIFQVKNRVFIV